MDEYARWILPIAGFLVSITTLVLNRIDYAHKARREVVEALEERVRELEEQLVKACERETQLLREVQTAGREAREMMAENLSLRRDRDSDRQRITALERGATA